MIRIYGDKPCRIVVVHGGPGAPGSAEGLARELGKSLSVLEPMQSAGSIAGLVGELRDQIRESCAVPAALVGHSWGAWLAGLLAASCPELAGKLILTGCGPLDTAWVPAIGERRKEYMSGEERAEFDELVRWLEGGTKAGESGVFPKWEADERNQKMVRLEELVERADHYDCGDDSCAERAGHRSVSLTNLEPDGEMYAKIWPEAAKLRETGELLDAFARIRCPIVLVQGRQDPHPYEGVLKPLSDRGIFVETHILEKCGHSPWLERQAREEFFRILTETLSRT